MAAPSQQPGVERLFEAGRGAWPSLRLSLEEYAGLVGPALDEGLVGDVAGDLYLACACRLGRPEALAAFEHGLMTQVPAYLSRLEGAASLVEEVRQLLRIRLFVAPPGADPKIAEYRGRGPLGAWVRVVAINLALELKRSARGTTPIDDEAEALPQLVTTPNPELDFLRVRYGEAFRQAFAGALAALPARERTLLKLHLVHGLSIDKIGRIYQVHRSSAARWLVEVREALYQGTRERVLAGLALAPAELDSLLALLRSELDVSVRRLLASDDAPLQVQGAQEVES